MAAAADDKATLRIAILKTLLYADIFDFALTGPEIAHYLIQHTAALDEIQAALRDDPWLTARVSHRDGLYCLIERDALRPARRQRATQAATLWPTARRWGQMLAALPFVRGVIVTGALAAENPRHRDDIDYLIITQPGRLWLARALSTSIVRLARLGGTRLCPNYLLAESALDLDDHNLFTAHELAQMTPLYGATVHQRMRAANRWSNSFLPQATQPLLPRSQEELGLLGRAAKRGGEELLGGRLGAQAEAWVQRRKVAQLERETPPGADRVEFSAERCKGHFSGHGRRILAAYEARLQAYGLAGEAASAETSHCAWSDSHPTAVVDGRWSVVGGQRSVVGRRSSPLTLGFDATTLRGAKSGVGYYTSHLLTHLMDVAPDLDYLLLSNHPIDDAPGGRRLSTLYQFPNRTLWMQTILPVALQRERPTLCHFTNSIAPLPTRIPTVVTIHDMTLSLFPHLHPLKKHLVTRPIIPLVARHAAAVITVSESAKADIVRLLGIPADKVHVIYEAAAPAFRPLPRAEVDAVRERYGLYGRYILYVGTIEPRKNLTRLIEAYARLRGQGLPHKLLLVGQPGWHDRPIYARVQELGLGDDVIFTGYVPSADLPALYNLAEVFAFPSLYEGFGLPIIEAMACGTPVVTSRASSPGEIAGDAALTVDPLSVDDLAVALETILTQPELVDTLRQRGLARAASMSWAEAARQTLAVYQRVLETT